MTLSQANRLLNLNTALGPDVLVLTAFNGSEEMSQLFRYQLDMISDDPSIKPKDLVGTPIGWSIELADGSRRHWHGYVSQLAIGDVDKKDRRNYRVEVVPWLWFLGRTSDCKIFQETDIPTIIDDVLGEFSFADYQPDLKGQHKSWDYCVQYRETDLNFLSRLMEQEGMSFYFKHSDGAHKMVITDHANGAYTLPESKVSFPYDSGTAAVADHITGWERRFQYVSGKYAQNDYNFLTPNDDISADKPTIVDLAGINGYELYDYPGEYPDKGIGKTEATLRMEAEETRHEIVQSSSTCKSFQVGGRFTIDEHKDSSEKGAEVMITSIHHSASEQMGYESSASSGSDYRNTFTCIPSSRVYRPRRTTPKPIISGIQSAVITGPDGEEIFPDEYGRVKCQFHWDRYGQLDDKSSCWIRVAQSHSGSGFGAMDIPRIGEEVLVSFLEGDPDRPLVTGRVYHAQNMPHYPLPQHKTRTTLRTNSSKGGEGFNELTFEDLKDEERVYVQAQKNMDTRVKNDSKERIYGHRHQVIGWEKDGNKGGDQKEMVWQDKHLNVKRDQIEQIEGNYELAVGSGDADNGGNLDVSIEKQRTETIGEGNDRTVGQDERIKIGGSLSETIGANHQTKVTQKQAVEAGQEIHLKAGMKVIIEAGVQLSLVGPGGFVDIGPAGVTIQGLMVKVNSGGAAGTGSGAAPDSPTNAKIAAPDEPAQAWEPDA